MAGLHGRVVQWLMFVETSENKHSTHIALRGFKQEEIPEGRGNQSN
jgi:hypothetical protein